MMVFTSLILISSLLLKEIICVDESAYVLQGKFVILLLKKIKYFLFFKLMKIKFLSILRYLLHEADVFSHKKL